MPYPTVPDLTPFEGQQRPSLLAGGPYDEQLTAIEDYLRSLGSYVDGELATLDAKIDALTENVAAIVTALSGVTYTYAETPYALFEGLTPTGGTVTSPALAQISTQLAEDASSLEELGNEVNSLSQAQENMLNAQLTVPDTYSDGAFVSTSFRLFRDNGQTGPGVDNLENVLTNLALAAPNGDHSQVLGDIGTDLTSSPSVRSSAALTYAAEQPSYEGSVYDVPVDVTSEGLVSLATSGEFAIHQNETLLVCSSEYAGFPAGSVVEYTGADTVTLNQTGTDITSSLVTVYEPTGGGGGTGTLSLSSNGVLLDNGEPVTSLLITAYDSPDAATGFAVHVGENTATARVVASNNEAVIETNNTVEAPRNSFLRIENNVGEVMFSPMAANKSLTAGELAQAEIFPVASTPDGMFGVLHTP